MHRRTSTALALAIALILVAGLTACGPKDAPEPAPMMDVETPPAPAEKVEPTPAPDTSMDTKPSILDKDLQGIQDEAVRTGLLGDIFFDFDKFDLRADARERLQKNADFMNQYPTLEFGLEGHCDERGTNEYNLALGERRAHAAKDYLVSLGVSSNRVRTISYGEEKPFCMGHDESCWQDNRRGHFIVTGRTDG